MSAGPAEMRSRASAIDGDPLEAAAEAAIAACGGDARATVRALIVALGFLEDEVARASAMVSRGYARRAMQGSAKRHD